MQDFAPNTHAYNCPLTQTCKHTVMHAHKTQPPARSNNADAARKEGVQRWACGLESSAVPTTESGWTGVSVCALHISLSFTSRPFCFIPLLPSPFVSAFCRAVIFSEASANDKRAYQTQGRLVIINTRRQTYIIFTSPAYLPARLSVTGPKSHTVTVWVTGSPAASECWHILWENTSRPSVAHMWLHLVTKGALSKHHVHEFPALTLETHWE